MSDFDLEAMKNTIELSNQDFDSFVMACLDTEAKPSKEILAAAKLLDTEGL